MDFGVVGGDGGGMGGGVHLEIPFDGETEI